MRIAQCAAAHIRPHSATPLYAVGMRGRIRPRGQGVWQLVVDAAPDPVTGNRRQVYRTVKGTKKKAAEELAHLVVELGRGDHNGHDATVGQLIAAHLRNATISATTRDDYERVVKTHLPKPFAATLVWKVRPADVDGIYAELRDRGVSATRIHRLHDVLSVAFARAVKWGWVARSPMRDATPPPRPRRDLAPPGRLDIGRLLAAAEGEFAAWLRVAILTGARRGEICGLQWGDVDFDTASITIRRAIVYTPATGVVVKETKTSRARTIAVDVDTIGELARHRRRAIERALTIGTALASEAFVFARDLDGTTPWRPDFATYLYGELRTKAGVTTRLHDLRHAHATQLLGAGVDVRTVANRLGHARASTTLDIYGHALPANDRQASDVMSRLVAE